MASEETKNDKTAEKKPEPIDRIVVTRHRARIAGKQVAYTVTCGTMVIREEAEKEARARATRRARRCSSSRTPWTT
jgi:carboxypeptidase C (cathepsin A)